MQGKAKWGRSGRPAVEKRCSLEMPVLLRPCPHGRERDHVRQIQRRDRRLTHIGVHMPRQRSQPGFHRIQAFHHADEVAPLNDLFDKTKLFGRDAGAAIPHRDRRGDIRLPDIIGTEGLQGQIGVGRLVGSVVVHQNRRLVCHYFPDNGCNTLALCKPLATDFRQHLRRVSLVQKDGAG